MRCVLRSYCDKQKLKANEEDMDLAKQFERHILALGDLEWKCLLKNRQSFREDEFELERSDEKSIALGLGFVYKEESFERSNPHHVFTFVHETFQGYLAASYIAHNLRESEFYVLGQVRFRSVTWKYREVFLFVSGILREEASILFTQIGDTLQKDWDWSKCSDDEAGFFFESWKESGNAEKMANTLCLFLPFPRVLHVSKYHHKELVNVLEACARFSKVQTPAEVHVAVSPRLQDVKNIQRVLAGVPNVKTLILPAVSYSIDRAEVGEVLRASKTLEKVTFTLSAGRGEGWASALDVGLGADSSLSSIGLRIDGILNQSAIQAVGNLMFNECLSSLSISICGNVQESLAKLLARGLAGKGAVKFLDLCANGKLSFNGAYSFEEGILSNDSLRNVKISVNGELPVNWQAVGENLHAKLAKKGVVSSIYPNTFSKVKASQVTGLNRMLLSKTHLVKQNVTLNVWGELSGDGSKALSEVLLNTLVSHLTLNIHGQLTDEILRCTARCVKEQEKTSSITINSWVQMTEKEKNLVKELGLDKNPSVSLNVCKTGAPLGESSDSGVISSDEPSSLFAFFEEAGKVSSEKEKNLMNELGLDKNPSVSLNVCETGAPLRESSDSGVTSSEEPSSLFAFFEEAEKVSSEKEKNLINELELDKNPSVSLNVCKTGAPLRESSDSGVTSSEEPSPLFAFYEEAEKVSSEKGKNLINDLGLDKNPSVSLNVCKTGAPLRESSDSGVTSSDEPSSLFAFFEEAEKVSSEKGKNLINELELDKNPSVSLNECETGAPLLELSDSEFISTDEPRSLFAFLEKAERVSSKSLSLTINLMPDTRSFWLFELGHGLKKVCSLNSLTLAINIYRNTDMLWTYDLGEALARSTSLNSLTLAFNIYSDTHSFSVCELGNALAESTSLNSLTLAINNYGDIDSERDSQWGHEDLHGFEKIKFLTECNFTFNICGKCKPDLL